MSAHEGPESSLTIPAPRSLSACNRRPQTHYNEPVPQTPSDHRVQLITKPGCHLCDDARAVVETVTAELGMTWEDLDAGSVPELMETYAEEIPVLLVDGVQRDFWRIDPKRLTRLLSA